MEIDFSSLAGFVNEEIFDFLFTEQQEDASNSTTSMASGPVEGVANSSSSPTSCSVISDERDEIQRLLQKNTNANTAKSTKNWVSKFSKWAIENQVHPELEEIPESELDGVLQRFFAQIRKNDGENYEPESLKVMQASLDRYLRDKGCTYSILKDSNFTTSRKVLNSKAIDLQQQGMGKRKRKADSLTYEEEERIWSSGVLDGENPTSLNYLVFFLVSQHMGTRG